MELGRPTVPVGTRVHSTSTGPRACGRGGGDSPRVSVSAMGVYLVLVVSDGPIRHPPRFSTTVSLRSPLDLRSRSGRHWVKRVTRGDWSRYFLPTTRFTRRSKLVTSMSVINKLHTSQLPEIIIIIINYKGRRGRNLSGSPPPRSPFPWF